MKKITLSAAIVALAMMGCSDAGLDNSVASTNEVKSEQNPNFLAKKGDRWPDIQSPFVYQHEFIPVGSNGILYIPYGNLGIEFDVETHFIPNSNNTSYNAIGKVHAFGGYSFRNPDLIRVMTLPLYNCRMNPNAYCDHAGYYPNGTNLLNYNELSWVDKIDVITKQDSKVKFKYSSLMNAITYYLAVWNKGQTNQVILAGTIFNGEQFKANHDLAQKAYHMYFEPAVADYFAKLSNN